MGNPQSDRELVVSILDRNVVHGISIEVKLVLSLSNAFLLQRDMDEILCLKRKIVSKHVK